MWKDWLAFSRREQYGIVVLSTFIFVLVAIRLILPLFSGSPQIELIAEMEFMEESKISSKSEADEKLSDNQKTSEYSFFSFDPNEVSVGELSRMGLPAYVIVNWMKYREAGGEFRSPAEVQKIYGLDSLVFAKMLPFISIPADSWRNASGVNNDKPNQELHYANIENEDKANSTYSKPVLIDINKADTAELKRLKGIGPVFSQRIVAFRSLLGGFYNVEQLNEVYGFPTDLLEMIREQLVVDRECLKKIEINTLSLRALKAHPYINFYQAREIVEYRNSQGPISGHAVLDGFSSFDSEAIEKVLPYLSFNDKNESQK